MMTIVFIVSSFICFIGLFVGSITDLRTKEVPDILNFGLLAAGFGIALLASIVFWDISYIVSSILGFSICFLLSCLMFYTGQWGGGDAKMLMAVGALLGLPLTALGSFSFFSFDSFSLDAIPFLFIYLLLVFFVGGVYGLFWLIVLIIRHWHPFIDDYFSILSQRSHKRIQMFLFVCIVFFLILSLLSSDSMFELIFSLCTVLLFFFYYSYHVVKVIEKIAFVHDLPLHKVTEGDWVAEDILVDGKIIVYKKDLGISAEQIAELHALAKKKKIKTVKIKYGLPFVPSFFIAFVITVLLHF